MRKGWRLVVAALAVGGLAAIGAPRAASAQTLPWTVTYPHKVVFLAGWGSQMAAAISDLNFDTRRLEVGWASWYDSNPYKTAIKPIEGPYCRLGAKSGMALPYAWDGGAWIPCATYPDGNLTGRCGRESVRYAYIIVNACHAEYDTLRATPNWDLRLIVHETGHVLGLGHVDCGGVESVMKQTMCFTLPQFTARLTGHDKQTLRSLY